MHKLTYAFFAILAVGLIYVGLQSNSPSDLPAPAADVELSVDEEAIVVEEPLPSLEADLQEALAAVQDPQFPNFDEMMSRRVVRALVVYSKTAYFLDGAVQRGLSYDALREFEAFLNRKLKTGTLKIDVIFLPVTRGELIPALVAGRGDIAVANLTITPDRQALVDFSTPAMKDVSELLVTSAASGLAPATADDLAGLQLHLRKSSSYYQSVLALNATFAHKGLAPVEIVLVDENLEDEDLLEMVNANLVQAIVVDSHKARFWRQIFDDIRIHEGVRLRKGAEIAWAFRKDSPKLKSSIDEYLRANRAGTLHGNVLLTRYLKNTDYIRNSLNSAEMAKFNDTAHLFQKYATEYNFDWLMVMAQAYQESRLDHSARSRSGAIGIMQVLPSTAADKNVAISDITSLENNIHAGVKYLRFIRDHYFDGEDMTEVDKTLFAFASYNAGPARITKLRQEAKLRDLDPNVWFENVEVIAARRIGRETVQYVSNIYKYWVAYQLSLDELASLAQVSSRG